MGLFSRFASVGLVLLLAKEAASSRFRDAARIERNCRARDALFTARRCANLFASASRQTKNFAYSHSKTKNAQPSRLP
jgi:hypothetical protein